MRGKWYFFLMLATTMAFIISACEDDPPAQTDDTELQADITDISNDSTLPDSEEAVADITPETQEEAIEDTNLSEFDGIIIDYTGQCEQEELATCESTTEPPTINADITVFVENNAIPLKCEVDSEMVWDFEVMMKEYQDKNVFMLGEVHGSNEIGMLSSELFEIMVREAGVNVLVMEIGMDATGPLNEFVRTGDDSSGTPINEYGFDMYSDNMFRKILPRKAHELYLQGIEIYVVGIDTPQNLAWVNEQIEAIAELITDETVKALILDELPEPREPRSYGMMGLESAYVDRAEDYHEHIVDNQDAICAKLDEANCEQLEFLAFTLYIGAVFVSEEFMMATMTGNMGPEIMEQMEQRERVIYTNYQLALNTEDVRVYAHMGAAHASKEGWTVARRLNEEYPMTIDRVFTTASSYGPGSEIFYGFSTQTLPPEPMTVSNALKLRDIDRYFISTNNPGFDCQQNPYLDVPVPQMGGTYGNSWDAFVWYKELTPERTGFGKNNSPKARFVQDQIRRMEFANEVLRVSNGQ